MVDTHCHLNLSPLSAQASTVVERAMLVGVTKLVIVGTDISSSIQAVEIAKRFHQYATVGIHPELGSFLGQFSQSNQKKLLSLWKRELGVIANDTSCVAIGECGLDYSFLQSDSEYDNAIRKLQSELFLMQARLAHNLLVPLTIHCRSTRGKEGGPFDAYADLRTLLTTLKADNVLPRFVLHCVSGPLEYVNACLNLGGYVSFAGNVTYPSSKEIQSLLKLVPPNRLLLETDAPFLSPQGLRGSVNSPENIVQTAAFVATILGTSVESLDQQTSENAATLFSI